MLHVHILSWVLAIILFIAAYLNFSKTQGATPFFKPLQMALRLFMLLTLISGFWVLIQEFMAASHGGGGNHLLLTLKMIFGIAVITLMEMTLAKRKKNAADHKWFWITIVLFIITLALGVILPWGPISSMFGVS